MFPRKAHVSACSLLVTTTALILVSLSLGSFNDEKPRELLNRALDAGSKILFGHIWRYGEYCADQRDVQTEMEDDIELEQFFNGSTLKSLTMEEARSDLKAIDQLVYKGIKARTHSNYICAVESWGYADEQNFQKSQSPLSDQFECRKSLDKLYNSYRLFSRHQSASSSRKILNNNSNNNYTKQCSHKDCNESHFEHWFILNTFGRAPSGPIYQTHVWPGDYAGCTASANWRHCYAALKSSSWPTRQSGQFFIRVGVCLPSTCDERIIRTPESLQKLDQLVKFNLIDGGLNLQTEYNVTDLHCPPSVDSAQYQAFSDPTSKLLAVLAIVWLAIILYANALLPLVGPSTNKTLGMIGQVFSFKINWLQFKQEGFADSHLKGLNAIKVIAMNWLVCTHVLMIMGSYIVNAQEMRDRWQNSLLMSALSQGQHIVSGFFVMSGVLIGYKYFRNGTRPQGVTLRTAVKMITHRYMRLMPLYLVAYAYTKQFGHLLSRGPFWDAGVSAQSEFRQCRAESWLIPLLTLANFVPPWAHCILTGWHLANDFQIFLALPLLLLAYSRSRLTGRLLTGSIFVLTHLYHLYLLHSSESFSWDRMAAEPLIVGARHMADRLMYDYLNPIGRAGTYFLGVLVADFVYLKHNQDDNSTSRVSGLLKARLFLLIGLALMLVPLFGVVIVPMSIRGIFGRYRDMLSYNIIRIMAEIGWSFIVYYLLTRNKHEVKQQLQAQKAEEKEDANLKITRKIKTRFLSDGFLELPVWNKLVKLNYCVMLIHFKVLHYIFQSQAQLITFSGINLFAYSSIAIVVSYASSIFMHLLVEVPLSALVNKLLI